MSNSLTIDGEACALGEIPQPSSSILFSFTQLIPMKGARGER